MWVELVWLQQVLFTHNPEKTTTRDRKEKGIDERWFESQKHTREKNTHTPYFVTIVLYVFVSNTNASHFGAFCFVLCVKISIKEALRKRLPIVFLVRILNIESMATKIFVDTLKHRPAIPNSISINLLLFCRPKRKKNQIPNDKRNNGM